MRQFAEIFPEEIRKQVVSQLPWGHIIVLMQKVKNKAALEWYAQNTLQNSISRNILIMQIEQDLYERQGKIESKISNFQETLPKPQSDLALQMLKSPYNFDFLTIGKEAHERDIENALIAHMEKFLLELGKGFAFVGRQYRLSVDNQDYFLDLLFYNLHLRSFIVIELKNTEFKPEYAGKMNFYLSVVDDKLKHQTDNPSIGIILCRSKNKIIAEYALRNMTNPIGLAEYKITEAIPENLKSVLPTIEEIEFELEDDVQT